LYWFYRNPVKHQENFNELMKKFGARANASDYKAACYIVAHPEVYDHVEVLISDSSPVSFYWKRDKNGEAVFDEKSNLPIEAQVMAELSSGYAHLVRAGVMLFTDRLWHFDVNKALGTWGDDLYKTYIQGMEIVRRRECLTILQPEI